MSDGVPAFFIETQYRATLIQATLIEAVDMNLSPTVSFDTGDATLTRLRLAQAKASAPPRPEQ
jgi:hypothetical protein